jgi:phytoene synthase
MMTSTDMTQSTSMASAATESTVEEAYALCRRISHRHGANFSVGFRFLPDAKRRAVYAAYAFCRWVDDIADDPGNDVPERLDLCEAELEACYEGSATHPITIALRDAIARFPIPKSAFAALIRGCRQDLEKSRYATFDELLGYCDLVATSISDISLSIFGFDDDRAPIHGRNLATALQLTNVTRDVGDDLDRDRIYVPQDELLRFGVSEEQLFHRDETEGTRALIEFQIARAEDYFRRAEPLLATLKFDARFPTLLMGGVYATVLGKLKKDPFAVLRHRVRLSTAEKLVVIARRALQPHFVV